MSIWTPPARPESVPPRRKPYARTPTTCKVGAGGYAGRSEQGGSELVPSLRLRGRWLQQLGIGVGTRLRIIHGEGAITLEVINE
ncbi:MAG: hypothetical protein GAK31_03236 [Stenotrophomonas maltophilia]|uniref:Toxin SymE-like domain-containing protein n=1 Tax=Stenotrophomonas maltophilia TaxID=40324 RepID=A0A7V8FF33_STEMA|nr:MAG: hypothetical protein GAK31_03236 [Stenotrophomonas maltophilia]